MGKKALATAIFLAAIAALSFQNCGQSIGLQNGLPKYKSTTGTNPGIRPTFVSVPRNPPNGVPPDTNFSEVFRQSLCSYLYFSGVTNYFDDCLARIYSSTVLPNQIYQAALEPQNLTFASIERAEVAASVSYNYSSATSCFDALLSYQNNQLPEQPRPTTEPDFRTLEKAAFSAIQQTSSCTSFIVCTGSTCTPTATPSPAPSPLPSPSPGTSPAPSPTISPSPLPSPFSIQNGSCNPPAGSTIVSVMRPWPRYMSPISVIAYGPGSLTSIQFTATADNYGSFASSSMALPDDGGYQGMGQVSISKTAGCLDSSKLHPQLHIYSLTIS